MAEGITGAPDPVEQRIQWLVATCLEPLAHSADGWGWLFRDPGDGRLWEQTFPLGSLHGAGPRRLAVLTHAEARGRYPHLGTDLPGGD